MRPITAPLNPDSTGAEVANLQDGLLLLLRSGTLLVDPEDAALDLVQAITDEQQHQAYGGATEETVRRVQGSRNIEASGTVDFRTAAALNEMLRDFAAFIYNDRSPRSGVAGHVVNADDTPFKGRVVLFGENDNESVHLGADDTDPEGNYAIDYAKPDSTGFRRLRVAAFDVDNRARATEVVDAAERIQIVNLTVTGNGPYLVSGHVFSSSRAGTGQLTVSIIDRNVGGDTTLIDTVSGPDGSYSATFGYAGDKQKPDLQACVVRDNTVLGSSEVRYNAGTATTLDIHLSDAATTSLSAEHDTLTADLAAHYDGSLADLQENGQRQDITFLANKTGWDARAVALAALADKFSTESKDGDDGLHPALFYALFRAGLPTDDTLFQLPSKSIATIWQQGVAQGIVPAGLTDALPDALQKFQTLSAGKALSGPATAGVSSLTEMLAVSMHDADDAQRRTFAQLQVQHEDSYADLWQGVEAAFGPEKSLRLQLDGKLAYLTLNNASLIGKLHEDAATPLTDPVGLLDQGLYKPDNWLELIDTVPPEILGADDPTKRTNYATVLATQLRISYPTATVAAMVRNNETPTATATPAEVHDFLIANHSTFDIGTQPIDQYVARNQVDISPEVRSDVARIQRVRQITVDDEAANALLHAGIDSAFAAAQYDRDEFVAAFAGAVGGSASAALIHARAQQIHAAVLNLTTSYALASNAPGIGVNSPAQVIDPAPQVPDDVGDVIAYPTLTTLFGEIDYCDCEDCRSILSPAAYLVDLLQFVDRDTARWTQFTGQWHTNHGGAPYPFADTAAWTAAGQPADTEITPLQVLLSRRPDLQYLPLTCQNTNTAMPYIDLVNETLEYFVTNQLSLDGYQGHSTDDRASSEQLLANPQFVQDSAYDVLAGNVAVPPLLPPTPPLPFHQPLQRLRRLFVAFDTTLTQTMEALRVNDDVERAADDGYGWRDIWMEQLGMSRPEYRLLTDRTLTLAALYGLPAALPAADVITSLSNAKDFCTRLAISYDDLLAILATRFVNPSGILLPKLARLGVSLKTIKDFHDGVISDDDFDAELAPQVDPAQYGGDIKAWIKNDQNFHQITALLVLADPSGPTVQVRFDALEFRYADPDLLAQPVRSLEFVRLLRFIRLWKMLGWTIHQTDAAITALYPADQLPNDPDDAQNLARLDTGFLALLPRLGIIARLIDRLDLRPERDLLSLLACFAPIDAYGDGSLYRTLFLNPGLTDADPVFGDDGYGTILDDAEKLLDHEEALRAATGLTGNEFDSITTTLRYTANTALTIDAVSDVYRRGWLARKLRLSVTELLRLIHYSGIDPFAALTYANPAILRFLDLVDGLRAANIKPATALYLIWNEDLGGTAAPPDDQINGFAVALRTELAGVESSFGLVDDPDGQIARARMAMVYDTAATDFFFGLLEGTVTTDAPYTSPQPTLPDAVTQVAADRLSYDAFRKRLSFVGVMSEAMRDALTAADATAAFRTAVTTLYQNIQHATAPLFTRYPELRGFYDTYAGWNDPPTQRRPRLLALFLPALLDRRKRQQTLATVSTTARTDTDLTAAVLTDPSVLRSADGTATAAIADLIAIENHGLTAHITFPSDPGRPALDIEGVPQSTLQADTITGTWTGYLQVPTNDSYELRIDTDANATVTITIGDARLVPNNNRSQWTTDSPIDLVPGRLYPVTLRAEGVRNTLQLWWQTAGRGWELIADNCLYPQDRRDRFAASYTRFLKASALAAALKISASETAYLAGYTDYRIGGKGWLNAIRVSGKPTRAQAAALLPALTGLLSFASLKTALSPGDERLLAVLRDPQTAAAKGGLLYDITGWDVESVSAVLARFNKTAEDLRGLDLFARVRAALQQSAALGITTTALIAAATNNPAGDTVRNLQKALQARYSASDWLDLIKPVNDDMRSRQRDALVGYVLHQMRSAPQSAHIDTPEKLFEYFLMDVQMAPCMQTSRVRSALSAVQLFIDRCLMNLEKRVAPSAINGTQWEWMKRYRVWEANRKVFLWPENWLEPELRDNQSPIFKEMMSELLQSDITEDGAAVALGKYLAKLDTLAKLEPCGVYFVENDPGVADDVAYVVARTAGTDRNYYWRRREGGTWMPWEQIKLNIADNPVIPVVWKNRIFLFWLQILNQTQVNNAAPIAPDKDLAALKSTDINTVPPQISVQAMLCWSEFYNGAWQPARTSDSTKPTVLGTTDPSGLDRASIHLSAHADADTLRVSIDSPIGDSFFLLYNAHSVPIRAEDAPFQPKFPNGSYRYLSNPNGTLTADYGRNLSLDWGFPDPTVLTRPILDNPVAAAITEPRHDLSNPWDAPFLYSDTRHVFYVSTTEQQVTVDRWRGYNIGQSSPIETSPHIPPIVVLSGPPILDRIGPVLRGLNSGIVNPHPIEHFISNDAYITKALGTIGTVKFGQADLGPAGQLGNEPTQ